MAESFPRQEARTRRFTLGAARTFRVSPDGARVVYLRTRGGTDPVTCLWAMDVASGRERLVADPRELGAAEEDLPPQERARRERVRESAGGIVAYATDAKVTTAVFALSGHVYAADLTGSGRAPRPVPTRTPALDPHPDPTGRRLAYVTAGALRVTGLGATAYAPLEDRAVADPEGAADVTYGLPEFIAAEEMHRRRGYWWSPDGSALLVARVDETPVNRWHIADPAHPEREPVRVAYPAAGTPNADVCLLLVTLDGGSMTVDTGTEAYPYLVTARWQQGHNPLVVVQSRDQRTMRLLTVDPGSGRAEVLHTDTDPRWLEIVTGVPAWTADGRIVWTRDDGDTRRLVIGPPGGEFVPVTPPGLQVRAVLDVDGDSVLFQASAEPTEIQLWSYSPDGLSRVGGSDGEGIESGTCAGGTTVVVRHGLDHDGGLVRVYRDGAAGTEIATFAESPALPAPRPVLIHAGPREIRTAVLFPSWHEPGQRKLPVLVDPYGGPGAQRVIKARGAYLTGQWFAEQGFAVVTADGRGTPARGPGWEHAIAGDFADPVLEDQVDALHAAADRFDDLDTDRVAIRGWSFGGYLAALAVLRRPDVFRAAVAGAPVTDWHLYDTHYTERYLGHPDHEEAAYERSSLINLAERAVVSQPRPLLLIHGLADDNVVVAHTLRLSAALLAAGYPHTVLPLSGITHMASQETVAENMLLLQLDFLRGALGLSPAD